MTDARKRMVWIVMGTIASVLVLAGGLFWAGRSVYELVDYHRAINLGGYADTPDLAQQGVTVLHGYTNETKSLCAGVTGCEQGYRSHQAEFRKFDSQGDAHSFAASHRDTYQSYWIVIRYTDPKLDAHNRHWAQNYFDNVTGTSN